MTLTNCPTCACSRKARSLIFHPSLSKAHVAMSDGTTPYTAPPIDLSQLSSPGAHSTVSAGATSKPSASTSTTSIDTTSTPPSELAPPSHNTTAPGDQLVNAPAPDAAHLIRADASTVNPAAAELSPGDRAPAPATEQPSETDGSADAVRKSFETPASRSLPQGDQAPAPATESAPVASQRVQVDAPGATEPVPVPLDAAVARASTSTEPLERGSQVPTRQADVAPPATSKPVLPSAQGHIAEHPQTETDTDHVLPLGSDIHPVHQAAALGDAPDHLVNAQVEKQKADKRELLGKEPKGTIVPGMEDDKLWAMIRRFDVVSFVSLTLCSSVNHNLTSTLRSKLPMCFRLRLGCQKESRICARPRCRPCHLIPTNSSRTSNAFMPPSECGPSLPRGNSCA